MNLTALFDDTIEELSLILPPTRPSLFAKLKDILKVIINSSYELFNAICNRIEITYNGKQDGLSILRVILTFAILDIQDLFNPFLY